jgi:hypothetical protein
MVILVHLGLGTFRPESAPYIVLLTDTMSSKPRTGLATRLPDWAKLDVVPRTLGDMVSQGDGKQMVFQCVVQTELGKPASFAEFAKAIDIMEFEMEEVPAGIVSILYQREMQIPPQEWRDKYCKRLHDLQTKFIVYEPAALLPASIPLSSSSSRSKRPLATT